MKSRSILFLGLALLVLAPLAGRLAVGLPNGFLKFPPRAHYVEHAPFSAPVFVLFAALGVLAVILIIWPRWFGFKKTPKPPPRSNTNPRMPWWGWFGLLLNAAAWVCTWNRFAWLGPIKNHMFFPLWFGFILLVDGLVYRRTGQSRLSRKPREFFLLFPISAILWWYFEYLNRFVQNWWYIGVDHFSVTQYVIFATLCFSTVLPAMLGVADLLLSFPHFRTAYANGPHWKAHKGIAMSAVALGIAAFVLLAIFPSPCFFLTWLAPLAVLGGCLAMAGQETCFDGLKQGDYTRLGVFAVAALVCGFFWEMWNFWSLPKWYYTVPYVNAFRVFEMPVVGFAGYLPFGPICLCLWLTAKALIPEIGATPRPSPSEKPGQPA